MYDLVVTRPFAEYKRGDRITDPKAVESALREYAGNVVRVSASDPQSSDSSRPAKKK